MATPPASEVDLINLEKTVNSQKPLYDALKEVEDAQSEKNTADQNNITAQTGSDESAKIAAATALGQAKDKVAKLKDAAAYVENFGSLRAQQDFELKEALTDIYRYEREIRDAQEAKNADNEQSARHNLEAAKTKW